MSCKTCESRKSGERETASLRAELGTYTWDVRSAKNFCSDGREALLVPSHIVEYMLKVTPVEEEHLLHVGDDTPGIVARIGNKVALIDGAHRAQKKRSRGQPFYAYMLTQQETEECLISVPYRSYQPMKDRSVA